MTTNINIKEIKPLYTSILTTLSKFEEDFVEGGIVKHTAGETKKYQKVISVGSMVRDVKAGDMVCVNPAAYAKTMYDPNSVKTDMGKNKVVMYDIPTVDIDGETYMILQERDIVYVITKYDEIKSEEKTNSSGLIIPKVNLNV